MVVSAAPDAPPSVADVGVSAEVGDRRAEARVRLRVLPSAASEAYTRGRELLARGEQARAIEEFSEAIKLDPGHAWAYCFRAVATHIAGRPREALADYTEAIRLKPDIDIAYGARGRIHYETGDLTGRWPITTRRSGSSPTTRSPLAPEAGSTPTWASTTGPWRTTPR